MTEILERSVRRGNASAEQVRRRGIILERFRAQLAFDVAGESAVVINADVLDVLCKEGINSELVSFLATRSANSFRDKGVNQPQQQESFITPLGLGLVNYREMDES